MAFVLAPLLPALMGLPDPIWTSHWLARAVAGSAYGAVAGEALARDPFVCGPGRWPSTAQRITLRVLWQPGVRRTRRAGNAAQETATDSDMDVPPPDKDLEREHRRGRLAARPRHGVGDGAAGLHSLALDGARKALLYVPETYDAARPSPLVVSFHGAGGHAQGGLWPLMSLADEARLLVLAPASRAGTWDVIRGGYGPDVAALDRVLGLVFERYAVEPARLGVGGFSDGASYALSVAIANGDLFTHVLAFSPGFAAPLVQVGAPRFYVSHGVHDEVLPIEACSRRLVPRLQRAGYDVLYREFDGPHTVPDEIAGEAVEWLLA